MPMARGGWCLRIPCVSPALCSTRYFHLRERRMTIHCQAGRGVVVCCIAVTASLCSQLHRANAAEPPTENSKTTATAATTLPATTESREQAKRIGEVMQSLVQDEADAVQAGKQDPSQSLRTLENLEKRMVSIDAAGCPDDFRIEFLRCTHGLD